MIFSLLVLSFLYLAVSGAYFILFAKITLYFEVSLLLHIGAGLLFICLFPLFLISTRQRKISLWPGGVIYLFVLFLSLSGIAALFPEAFRKIVVQDFHAVVGFLGVLLSIFLFRRAKVEIGKNTKIICFALVSLFIAPLFVSAIFLVPTGNTGSLTAGTCENGGCHAEIHREWNSSAHHYSVETAAYVKAKKEAGSKGVRCAYCHDRFSAENAKGAKASKGDECVFCHRVKGASATDEVIRFDHKEQRAALFAGYEGQLFQYLRSFLLKATPDDHIRENSSAYLSSDGFCISCHRRFKDKKTFAKNRKGCVQCHMPSVKRVTDVDGRSHRFVASNYIQPLLRHDAEQFRLTKEALSGMDFRIDIFEPRDKRAERGSIIVDNRAFQSSEPSPYVTMGERVELKIMLTFPDKEGHRFPGSAFSSRKVWVETTVFDSSGNKLLHLRHSTDDPAFFMAGDEEVFSPGTAFGHDFTLSKKALGQGTSRIIPASFFVPNWVKGDIVATADLFYERSGEETIGNFPAILLASDSITVKARKLSEKEPELLHESYFENGVVKQSNSHVNEAR